MTPLTERPATDQSKLARSRLAVAHAITAHTAGHDPHDTADRIIEELQALGWQQPPDPGVIPPPVGPGHSAATRAAAMKTIREELAEAKRRRTERPSTGNVDR